MDGADFFAPAPYTLIDGLLARYDAKRSQIEQVVALFDGDIGGVVHYFIHGNRDNGGYSSLSAERIFRRDGAIAALNSAFWAEALALTDVYDCMPQARRDEWNKQITDMTAPEFEADTVRATLESLLLSRETFFAERIDGIFRALSHEHVTNAPEGFGKRMIVANVLTYYDTVDQRTVGYINDLRCVIARFMGRDEPRWNNTGFVINALRKTTGVWHSLDGGAIRVRLYKKGTAHLEVHPDMAWRLNAMLAHLYPRAIPSALRTRPIKRPKHFALITTPIPFAVLAVIEAGVFREDDTYLAFRGEREDKATFTEALRVLESVGGIPDRFGVRFTYHAAGVVTEIVLSGRVPDQKTHQFYPSRGQIAADAIALADIGETSRCCEPSAGQGDLAEHMPQDRTTCVEVNALFCDVLRAKGFKTINADFLEWATTAPLFDRLVLNPPFSENRASLHFAAALRLVAPGGRIAAILPASLAGRDLAPGWDSEWTPVYTDAFAGTSVSVAIYAASRPA